MMNLLRYNEDDEDDSYEIDERLSKFRVLDLKSGETFGEIKTIDLASTQPSKEGEELLMKLLEDSYIISHADITQCIKNIQYGFSDLPVLEMYLSRLVKLPLNWHRRCSSDIITDAIAENILDKGCPGISTPTTVVSIITTWEIFDNEDGTRQYIIKNDNAVIRTKLHTTTCITDLTFELPYVEGVEYNDMHVAVKTYLIETRLPFEKKDNKWTVTIPGLIWVHSTHFDGKINLTIVFTASKEIGKQLALTELVTKFNNIILNYKLDQYLFDTLDCITIKKIDGTIQWINRIKPERYPSILTYLLRSHKS